MKNLKKVLFLIALVVISMGYSQVGPPTPVGPGAPASPIDDYLFILLPLAVILIAYVGVKFRRQLN